MPRWFTSPRMVTHPSTNQTVHGQESNLRSADHESDALATIPPNHSPLLRALTGLTRVESNIIAFNVSFLTRRMLFSAGTVLGWRRSVVVSALSSINVVNRHWARLVLGWVTVCERVNHLGM